MSYTTTFTTHLGTFGTKRCWVLVIQDIYIYMAWKLNTHQIFFWMSSIWGMHFCSNFFCNHWNLLFSMFSENSSIGTSSCKWVAHCAPSKAPFFHFCNFKLYSIHGYQKSNISSTKPQIFVKSKTFLKL